MASFWGLDKHTETSHIFLVVQWCWCVSETLDYLSIILYMLFGDIRSSDLYNTNPILLLQYNNVQYALNYFIITTSLCGLCVAQQGKNNRGRVYKDSLCILSVFLSHAFNFFPPSPYSHVLASFASPLPPSFQMEIHSTPSSSCSSSSSHLSPPPLSGPEPRQ